MPPVSDHLFSKEIFRTFVYFLAVLLVCKLYNFGLQITHLVLDHFKLMDIVDIGDCLVVEYLERSDLTFVLFVFFWSLNCITLTA